LTRVRMTRWCRLCSYGGMIWSRVRQGHC
jgi:hypothetical protein